jgi:hypothetical protein
MTISYRLFPFVSSIRRQDTFYLYLQFFTVIAFQLRCTLCLLKDQRKPERTEFVWDAEDGRLQVLTKTSVPKSEAITEGWRRFKNVQLIVCTPREILLIL